jgi:hypothetical protein
MKIPWRGIEGELMRNEELYFPSETETSMRFQTSRLEDAGCALKNNWVIGREVGEQTPASPTM